MICLERVEIGNATLYYADCADVIASIECDAIVTDPPYGISYRSNHNSSQRGQWAKWARTENLPGIVGDDRPLDPSHLLEKKVPTVIFGGNYGSDQLPATRCWIVWDKRDGISPNNQADCELAWTNINKPSRIHRQLWSGLLRAGEENICHASKDHPHQKPVALMRFCIDYAGGNVVLDPYMGSGSTGVAAIQMKRRFVGIEIERKYFDVACERIELAQRQRSLELL